MNTVVHELISSRLDELKQRGLLAEYFVAWRGSSGDLRPNVTAWCISDVKPQELECEVLWLLGDLVPSSEIEVLPVNSQAGSLTNVLSVQASSSKDASVFFGVKVEK